MQDNRLDEQFTDHAWNEMRQLLDKEMPVRGGLWFTRRRQWMAAAAVLLLLVTATSVWRWTVNGKLEGSGSDLAVFVPPVEAQEQQAAEEAQEKRNKAGEVHASTQAEGNLNEASALAQATVPPAQINSSRVSPGKQAPATLPGVSGKDSRIGDTPDEGHGPTTLAGLSNTAVGDSEPAATIDLPVQQMVLPEIAPATRPDVVDAFVQLESRQTLIENATPALDMEARIYPAAEEDKADKKAFALLPDRWGVQGSTVAGGKAALDGMAVGLTGEFRFGSSPWSLQSGVRYLYQNRNFSFQEPGAATREATDQNTLNNGGVSTSAVFDPKTFPIAARTHSLNLPVMIDYRIGGGKLGIQAGVQMNYAMLAQRSDDLPNITPAFKSISAADTQTLDLVQTQSEAAFQNNLMERWDVGLAGGLHYQAGKNIGLNLRYNFGLVDLVRSDYYAAYNRFFGMGVTFYLR